MATPLPPPPRLRNIGLGILIVAVLVVLVCSASSAVKWAGSAFLVLPRAIGVLESVRGDEIAALPMDSSPTAVTFPRPERYQLYTGDLDLLEVAASLHSAGSTPWLTVQRAETGEAIPVSFVGRGLTPYDDPRVPGRPIFAFEIPEAGTYALSHPQRPLIVSLVPDRTSGKEVLIGASFLAQLGLLAIPAYLVFGRPWLERRQSWRRHQQEQRRASEAMLRRRPGPSR